MEVGDPDDWDELLKSKCRKSSDPIVVRYINYGLIHEDLRTIIHLNGMIKELLQKKIFFIKIANANKTRKKAIDLEEVKLNIETDNTLLIQSLYTTTIITYAKWFTKSSGGKKTKLEPDETFKSSSKSIRETHELAMHLRNFYFAHGGSKILETSYPLYIKDPISNEELLFSIPNKTRLPPMIYVRKFDKLYADVFKTINLKMHDMRDRVIEAIKKSAI